MQLFNSTLQLLHILWTRNGHIIDVLDTFSDILALDLLVIGVNRGDNWFERGSDRSRIGQAWIKPCSDINGPPHYNLLQAWSVIRAFERKWTRIFIKKRGSFDRQTSSLQTRVFFLSRLWWLAQMKSVWTVQQRQIRTGHPKQVIWLKFLHSAGKVLFAINFDKVLEASKL